jgi:hypothetical protein
MSKLQDDFSKIPMKQPLESVRPVGLKKSILRGHVRAKKQGAVVSLAAAGPIK